MAEMPLSSLLFVGGPLDGKRHDRNLDSIRIENLEKVGTYTRLRLHRRVKDYMNEPHPIAYLESASVLIWEWDGSFESLPDARFTQARLDDSDWTRVAGTETRIPALDEEARDE